MSSFDANTKLGQLFAGFMMLQGAVEELQGGGGGGGGSTVRNVVILNGGGAGLYTYPNGTVAYSVNQNPGQIVVDADSQDSPAVGTEYVVCTGNTNSIYLQNQKPGSLIQISNTSPNTSNANVNMPINSKCTLTKLTANLWMVQGDGLTYAS